MTDRNLRAPEFDSLVGRRPAAVSNLQPLHRDAYVPRTPSAEIARPLVRDAYVARESAPQTPLVRDAYVARETSTRTPLVRDAYTPRAADPRAHSLTERLRDARKRRE